MKSFYQFAIRCVATVLLLLTSIGAFAQTRTVTGTVRDAVTNLAMTGVMVSVEGTATGDITDAKGNFRISVNGNQNLVFSFMGYEAQTVPTQGVSVLDVVMREQSSRIDDVVVIGYGKTTKKELTGSVSSLRESDLPTGAFNNAAGMLQGKVAGLSITNPNGGDPNAKFEILLRGTSTLKAGQGPLIIIDGVAGEDMRNINFQEIESIDVLKDGSAAAIYGVRGTNGVLIITTKRARQGTTQVEYDGQVSTQSVARRATPLSASQFEDAINKYAPANVGSLYGASTDWFDEITRTPISHKHSLTVSGGSKTFSHRTVMNIEQNQGLQRKNKSDKYMFKTNIHQSLFKGWFDIDYNAYFSKRKYTPANYDAFRQAFLHNPTEPVYDPSNTESGGYYRITAMDYYNPVAMVNERDEEYQSDNFGFNVRGTLNVLAVPGLKWDNFVSYKQERYEQRSYRTAYYPSIIGTEGKAAIYNEYSNDLQWESTLNYSKQIGRHSVQALLGYTWQEQMNQYSSMSNSGFDTDSFLTNNIGAGSSLAQGTAEMASHKESNRYIAFFGRVMYNYDERYLVSVSLRGDGSSRFGANNKWGAFPAVSLGWRMNRERWLRDVKWLDELKLRAGYGVTGNQDFDNYRSLMLMTTNGYAYIDGKWQNTYSPKSNSNVDLAWEKKSEWNVGLDFSFFGGRLGGAIDYYYRKTTGLLYDYVVPVPPYDYKTLFTNFGEVKNEGIELTINAIPVIVKDFTWSTSLTVSHNTNKLLKFNSGEFADADYKVGWIATPVGVYCQRLIEGESLGTFYAPIYNGLDDNGNVKLKNSIAGTVSESKWKKIGTAYPDAVLGWSNTFTYKGFDLGITMRLSIGGSVFNTYRATYENLPGLGLKNILSSWLDNTKYTGDVVYSSNYIEDATYLKIDNLSLGYNIPVKSDVVKRIRVYVAVQNLLCATKYKGVDPEVSLTGLTPGIEGTSYYPTTTSYTLGLNINF